MDNYNRWVELRDRDDERDRQKVKAVSKLVSCMDRLAKSDTAMMSHYDIELGHDVGARKQYLSWCALAVGASPREFYDLEPVGFPRSAYSPELVGAAWHVVGGDDGSEFGGYCYRPIFKKEKQEKAMRLLGRWPKFYEVLNVPADWAVSAGELRDLLLLTDGDEDSDFTLRGYTLYDALVCVSEFCIPFSGSLASVLGQERVLLSTVDVSRMPSPCDRVGGSTVRWHVTMLDGKVHQDGYCYLSLFRATMRKSMAGKYGPWPALSDILQEPRTTFAASQTWAKYFFVNTAVSPPVAIPASEALAAAAYDIGSDDIATTAGRLRRYMRTVDDRTELPRSSDVVGGVYAGQLDTVVVKKYRRQPYVQPVATVDAETVFSTVCGKWGVDSSLEDDVISSLAELFIHGTSNGAVANARFTLGDREFHCSALCDAVNQYVSATNSVRLWVKSFRQGELVLRMSELLANKDNVDLRRQVSNVYGAPVNMVHLCFDTSSVLRHVTKVTYVDRVMIRISKCLKMAGKHPPGAWRQSLRLDV